MTEFSDTPADKSSDAPTDKPETPTGTPETPSSPLQQPAAGSYPPPPYPYAPGPYPGGYPPPPWQPYHSYFPPPVAPKNGLGIASLVIAIVALVLVWSVGGGVILGAIAAVIGFVARGRVKRGEANNGGVAVAGIVLGIVAIVVGLIFVPIWMGLWNETGGGDYIDCLQKAGSDPVKQQQCANQFREHVEQKFSFTLTPSP
jgi:hypothetical protein